MENSPELPRRKKKKAAGRPRGAKDAEPRQQRPVPSEGRQECGSIVSARKDRAAMTMKRSLFLSHVREGYSIKASCEISGLDRKTVTAWLKTDKDFKEDYDLAFEDGTDALEDAVMERAKEAKGDLMAIFTLKGRRPQKWRENIKIEAEVTDKRDGSVFAAKVGDLISKLHEVAAANLARTMASEGHDYPELPDPPKMIDVTPNASNA